MPKQINKRNRVAGPRPRNCPDIWTVERWPVLRLREHPQQKRFFDPTADSMAEFQAELRNREIQPPIHALRDGTVVRGCLWLRAAVAEGRKLVAVTVRDDLGQPSSAAAVRELIQDNLRSRPVSNLELAACCLQLKRFQRYPLQEAAGDARDRIAEELGLGLSGRSLDRLARLLKLPLDIRKAIANRKISQSLGEQILKVPPDQQNQIASALAAGNSASQIVHEYRLKQSDPPSSAQTGFDRLVLRLKSLLPLLRKQEDTLVVDDENSRQAVGTQQLCSGGLPADHPNDLPQARDGRRCRRT